MNILVAIDATDCSTRALNFVADRAWRSQDRFLIVTVAERYDDLFDDQEGESKEDESKEARQASIVDACRKLTEKAVSTMKNACPDNCVESKVLSGIASDEILNCAADWNADLIVLGTHGHNGCRRFLSGSVAEQVLKQAPCSVEIVKNKTVCAD